jgi:HPt (histidine-containing phosphotransfer) domain-containing protein
MTPLLDRLGGDEALAAEVIAVFVEDCPARVTAIGRAVAARDAGCLRTAAHALKGAAGNVGATRVFESARRLEQIGKSGDLGGVDSAWHELSADAAGAIGSMRQWSEQRPGRTATCEP